QLELRYDGLRRLRHELRTYCQGGGPCATRNETTLVTNTWDMGSHGLGRLTSVLDVESGQIDYAYDTRGRLGSETHRPLGAPGLPFQLQYEYDGGLLSSIQYPPQTAGGQAQLVTLARGDDDEVSSINLGTVTDPNMSLLAEGVTHYPFAGGL